MKHTSKIRYDGNEPQEGGGNFQQALESARTKRTAKENHGNAVPGEVLARMGGLNQYDRNAREIFFVMSSETDYKC